MKKRGKEIELILPTTSQLEKELYKERYKSRYKRLLKSTFYALLVVAALALFLATLIFPVLQIYGNSMEPTLSENDIVVTVKKTTIETGDVIAFYYNNRILIKRVIATSAQWVNIDEEGNVFVNDKLLDEPYIEKKHLGEVDIEFPYQVPETSYFVLGDDRKSSIDSRNSLIGSVSQEDIIGKVVFRVWPIKQFGVVR